MSDRRFRTLERNVSLYPLYQILFNAYFWMPVFFLYFSEHLPLGRVLQLEAIYYAAVVLLEVPSGYLSDTVGRRTTLMISALALVAAYALFIVGSGLEGWTFEVFVGAQILLAAGISFRSGTDTALHFDTLSALERPGEYAAREASAHRYLLLGRAVAALLGGLAATWQLRFAYGLSLVAALALLVVVWLLVEPPVHVETEDGAPLRRGFVRQIGACLGQLSNRSLAWLMGFAVLMTVLNHVPWEFYQPYLDLLLEKRDVDLPGKGTPLVTGTLTAVMLVAASWAAARSIRIRDRIGLAPTLLLTTILQVVIIAAMGWLLHEVVLLPILLRSVPAAIMLAPLRGAITPQLPRSLRATYLSLQSLLGRLAFSGTLLLLAAGSTPGAAPDWPAISSMTLTCAVTGAVGLVVLGATARPCLARLRRTDSQSPPGAIV
jgi:MFS family permease